MQTALYIVPTPIGNLEDITQRSLSVLSEVDLIACEDTRHSGRLLSHYAIKTSLTALHQHNERQKAEWIVSQLEQGKSIALISDAGTPLISDPGYFLVAQVRASGFAVIPLPGACAAITALSASGLATDRFTFEGFLPAKSGPKKSRLEGMLKDTATLIFYESPHRIIATLNDMSEVFGDRKMVLARELTKTFETFLEGSIAEVLALVEGDPNQQKGEMVLMVAGYEKPSDEATSIDVDSMILASLKYLGVKQVSALVSELTGLRKKDIYQRALDLNRDSGDE